MENRKNLLRTLFFYSIIEYMNYNFQAEFKQSTHAIISRFLLCQPHSRTIFFFSCFCKVFPFLVFLILLNFPIYAQNKNQRPDIFIAPLAEVINYSRENIAYGGGIALGGGDGGLSLGIRVLYITESENLNTLEFNFFARYYIFASDEHRGLFVQINGGPAFFYRDNSETNTNKISFISFGIAAGWRFSLNNHFFLEPAIRVGYPYIVGAGVSAGYRF